MSLLSVDFPLLSMFYSAFSLLLFVRVLGLLSDTVHPSDLVGVLGALLSSCIDVCELADLVREGGVFLFP